MKKTVLSIFLLILAATYAGNLNAQNVTLGYSTYLGGLDYDCGQAIAVGSDGTAYITGYTESSGFPATYAYQPTFGGGEYDVFVSRLSSSGSILLYSTYLGGFGDDRGYGISLDAGTVYISGYTSSSNFPILNSYQPNYGGGIRDAFVSRLSSSGSILLYSTYLGGGDDDYGYGISVDSGSAYTSGYTGSPDFPTVNAYQSSLAGENDGYASRLSSSGSTLLYSTYLGGYGDDRGHGISVEAGTAYVTGITYSSDFPTINAYQSSFAGGSRDIYTGRLSSSGSTLLYSTYLGGYGDDRGYGISVESGTAYISGHTNSPDFPTANAYQSSLAGYSNASVSRLSSSGSALLYSTFLGGSLRDYSFGVAVEAGTAYVAGRTQSPDFPIVNAYQSSRAMYNYDVFVSCLAPTGSSLHYSTYLGGGTYDGGYGIALDGANNAYVCGEARSTLFPIFNAYQPSLSQVMEFDAFVTKFIYLVTTPTPIPSPSSSPIPGFCQPSTVSLDFDGTYDYGTLTYNLDETPPFSVSAWVYLRNYEDAATSKYYNGRTIIMRGNLSYSGQWDYIFNVNANYKLGFVTHPEFCCADVVEASDNFPLNEWVFVTFTHEGLAGKLYQNGQLVGTNNNLRAGNNHNGSQTFLGATYHNHYTEIWRMNFWDGLMDDLAVYNRALSQPEIESIYTTKSYPPSILTAHWKCNEGFGVTLNDSAGSNNGLLAGPSWSTDHRPNAPCATPSPPPTAPRTPPPSPTPSSTTTTTPTPPPTPLPCLPALKVQDIVYIELNNPRATLNNGWFIRGLSRDGGVDFGYIPDKLNFWFDDETSPEEIELKLRFEEQAEPIDVRAGDTLRIGYGNSFLDVTLPAVSTDGTELFVGLNGNTYYDFSLCNIAQGTPPTPTPTPPQFIIDSGDYNGDGTSEIAVFRQSSGLWSVRDLTCNYFGASADLPVSGDYDGDGTADIAVFRPASGLWSIRGVSRIYYGSVSDIPVPGDYNGDGTCDTGIFRPASGLWAIRVVTRIYYGSASDIPIPGDYDGDGTKDIAIFRSATGLWAGPGFPRIYFGGSGDQPVPGDYDGDGSWEPGIFHPTSGLWAIYGLGRLYYGSAIDQPVPADYDGDLIDDIGIFRSSSGLWGIRNISRAYFGSSGDIPVTR